MPAIFQENSSMKAHLHKGVVFLDLNSREVTILLVHALQVSRACAACIKVHDKKCCGRPHMALTVSFLHLCILVLCLFVCVYMHLCACMCTCMCVYVSVCKRVCREGKGAVFSYKLET